jgi:hypothetical protein
MGARTVSEQPGQINFPFETPQAVGVGMVQGAPNEENPSGRKIIIQFDGPNGRWVCFFDPKHAKAFAANVERAATTAETGLEIASEIPPIFRNGHKKS